MLAPVSPAAVQKYGKDFCAPTLWGPARSKFDSVSDGQRRTDGEEPRLSMGAVDFQASGASGYLDAISWRIIPEPATRLAALKSGETQVIQDVPTQEYAGLQHDGSIQLLQGPLAGSGFTMMINVTKAPTDDVRVRQALEWGLDKTAPGIKAVWQGVYQPAPSVITSSTFGYDPATRNVYHYDPKKAAALLDEAGWKMGPSGVRQKGGQDLVLEMYYRSDDSDFVGMATFMQAIYGQIGIKIDLQGLAQAGYFAAVRAGKHNLQYWWETGADPDVVRVLLYSKNADGGTNRNRYKNADMDHLIDQAAATTNAVSRKQLYAEIQMKTLQEAIMVPVADPLNIFAYGKARVTGPVLDWSSTDLLLYDAQLLK